MAQRQQKQNQRTVEGGSLAFAEYGKRLKRFKSLNPLWRRLHLHRRLQRARLDRVQANHKILEQRQRNQKSRLTAAVAWLHAPGAAAARAA